MVTLFVFAFLLGIAYVVWLSLGSSPPKPAATPAEADFTATDRPTRTPHPTRTPRPTRTPKPTITPTPTPKVFVVGIVAGHWKNDSGAVCADGLEEVTINLDVASRVVDLLQARGYRALLLPEFAKELQGLKADAFVSIHTDSCEYTGLSGFKVARVASSAIPDEEDRLVACLIQKYEGATGLAFQKDTITFDMTEYHAFLEIDPATPGAIIELGFMDLDRELLAYDSGHVADGVAQGIICFLEGN